jgi:A/G-specific adenine glycosylase
MSIAFNQREPAVDGNVMRVLSRYFCLEDDIAKNGTRVKMERLQWELIPDGVASDFNQALMELGALICTPKSPQCLICPVMEHCAGRLAGKEERLPVKTKGKPPRPEVRACAFVLNPDGTHILLRQRPSTGLLANMWELPHVELNGELDEITDVTWSASLSDYELGVLMEHWVSRVVGAPIEYQNTLGKIEHVFSHIHWHLRVFQLRMTVEIEQVTHMPYQWVNRDGLEQYPMPNVFTRILKQQSN